MEENSSFISVKKNKKGKDIKKHSNKNKLNEKLSLNNKNTIIIILIIIIIILLIIIMILLSSNHSSRLNPN